MTRPNLDGGELLKVHWAPRESLIEQYTAIAREAYALGGRHALELAYPRTAAAPVW